MYCKEVTYEDYNGETQTEKLYFNLTKTELTEMELSTEGGFNARLQRILEKKDIPTFTKVYRQFIIDSYGEKSSDGKRFVKNKDIVDSFVYSAAYDAFMSEMYSDDKAALEFIRGILPAEIRANFDKKFSEQKHLGTVAAISQNVNN